MSFPGDVLLRYCKRPAFDPVTLLIESADDALLRFYEFVQLEPDQPIHKRIKLDAFICHESDGSLSRAAVAGSPAINGACCEVEGSACIMSPKEGGDMTSGTLIKEIADVDSELSPPLVDIARSCSKMAEIDLKDTQKVAALVMATSLKYYGVVLDQAQQSFRSALWIAAVAAMFFIYSCWLVMNGKVGGATVSMIAGTLIQVISGINFYLYSRTARQFAGFHICLERMDRYLLANSYCENLSTDSAKDGCRQKMIEVIANAPMLTLEQVGISARPVPQPPGAAAAAAGH